MGGCVPGDANGNPPAGFVPEAANNAVADMGHPQVDHGGGAAIAGGIFKPCLIQDQAVEDLLHHWVQNSREIPSGRGHGI